MDASTENTKLSSKLARKSEEIEDYQIAVAQLEKKYESVRN